MNSLTSMGVKNSLRVFKMLMKDNISRVELSRKSGLTKTTVGEITRKFMNSGLIREREKNHIYSKIGKPQTLLGVVPEAFHVVGVGILRKQVEGCLVDAAGNVLSTDSKKYESLDYSVVIETVFKVVDHLFSKIKKIHAISIGLPGTLDSKKGIVLKPAKFVEFENIPIAKIFSDKYGVDVWIENDVDLAALAEKYYGKGGGNKSFIYVHLEEGIGAGIILNGEIYHGEYGYAGEVGHFLVRKGNKFRFLEDLYGIDAITEKAKKIGIYDFKSLIKAEKEQNEKALEIIEESARNIGAAILSAIDLTGISTIFIGGKAVWLGNTFLSTMKKIISNNLFYDHKVNIKFSNLGEALSVSLGASAYGRIKYVERNLAQKRKENFLRNSS